MQRTKRFFIWAGMLAFGVNVAGSQPITIDTNDVKAVFARGNRLTYHHDTLTTSLDVGTPGGPVTWDFSALTTSYLQTRKSVRPDSTLYAAGFPQATHAFLDSAFAIRVNTGFLGWATVRSSEAYYYYRIGSDLLYYGAQGAGNGYLDAAPTNPIPFTARWFEVPPVVEYSLPLEYPKSWAYDYADSLVGTATLFGVPQNLTMGDLYSVACSVDAYGFLTLPGEPARDALRIRKLSRKNSSVLEVVYTFVARNGAAVDVTTIDTAATGGTIPVSSLRWTDGVPDDLVPIQLASFTATKWDESSVYLEWTTLSEVNNFGFYVQWRGPDEREFTDVPGAFVGGHGTTVVPHTYSYRLTGAGLDTWWYRLKQVDLDGTVHPSEPVQVRAVTGVQEVVPASFELAQNYPNPFNPGTTIRYTLPHGSHVTLTVLNPLGQEVVQLVNGEKAAGEYSVQFDGSRLPSGTYFYRLQAGGLVQTRKMQLVR